jgi:octaprenyl-diphosphate synthase
LYGRHLGIAFQIIDDLLDYLSDSDTMGKNVGDDLAEGKATLPLIHAMRLGSDDDRDLIRHAIRKGGLDDLTPVLEIVQRNGSIDYSRLKAAEEIDKAKNAIAALPDTSFKETLNQIADLAIARVN